MIASLNSHYSPGIDRYEDIRQRYAESRSIDFAHQSPEKISSDVLELATKTTQENQKKLDSYLLSRNPQARNENGIYWLQTNSDQAANDVSQPIHTTSKGTSISVQTVYEDAFFNKGEGVYCDLTNQQGLHIQFKISQNTKITEGEDGTITIIQPDSRQKIVIDATGNSTFEYIDAENSDVLTGTDRDDILINVDKANVEAGGGDDTILNFANSTVLNAGGGNDTIHLMNDVSNVTINTDTGRNTIHGKGISNSQLHLNGEDTLEFSSLSQSDVRHSGAKAHIRGDWAENVSMQFSGTADVNIESLKSSALSAESRARVRGGGAENVSMAFLGESDVNIRSIQSSSLSTGAKSSIQASRIFNSHIEAQKELQLSSNSFEASSANAASIHIYASTIDNSQINSSHGSTHVTSNTLSNSQVQSSGETQAAFSMIYSSTIDTGIQNDRIRSHHIESSRIHTDDGDDLIEGIGISNSTIEAGKGNDNIVGVDYTNSSVMTGDGYDNLFFWNLVHINHDVNSGADKAYKINYQYLDAIQRQFVEPLDLLQNAHAQDVTGKLTSHKERVSLFV